MKVLVTGIIIIIGILVLISYLCLKVASDCDDSVEKVQWMKPGECPITPEQFEAIYNDESGENK